MDMTGVEFWIVNTDAQALQTAARIRGTTCNGAELTRGSAAGGNPEIGQKAAEESRAPSSSRSQVLIWCSLPRYGWWYGSGAPLKVAQVGEPYFDRIATMPLKFEGRQRYNQALVPSNASKCRHAHRPERSLARRRRRCVAGARRLCSQTTFSAGAALHHDIITLPGLINVDADARAVMADAGSS